MLWYQIIRLQGDLLSPIISNMEDYMSGMKSLYTREKKELETLAGDFGLLKRNDIRDKVLNIIDTCKNYSEGQRAIMRLYERVYCK